MPTSVMTRSTAAQLRAAASSSGNSGTSSPSTSLASTAQDSLRTLLGSCNGSNHSKVHHKKRHQSQSPDRLENGARAVTPPHTPPKVVHQNGYSSPTESHSRGSSPTPSWCPTPHSPPTPHRIRLLEEKENDKKPKTSINGFTPHVPQQNGHKVEPVSNVEKSDPQAKLSHHQTKLTNFFPIRRSCRKSKTEVEAMHQKDIEDHLAANSDSDLGLKVLSFPEKGRGVVSSRHITKGDFVVEYSGDLIDVKVAKERETKYAMDLSKGCYMYYFKANNRQYCIDATAETGRLGRLVNHSRSSPNLQTKVVIFKNTPRLILVARRDIEPGEELLYDYGDRSKESLEAYPWLAH